MTECPDEAGDSPGCCTAHGEAPSEASRGLPAAGQGQALSQPLSFGKRQRLNEAAGRTTLPAAVNSSWLGHSSRPSRPASGARLGASFVFQAHLGRNVLRRGLLGGARKGSAGRGGTREGAEVLGAAPPDAAVLLGACSGGSGGPGDEVEPLTKRHIDGIFTDSYSRYRKQMAVKKYLAAVLGKRYKQRVKNKGRRVAYL